MKPTRLRLRFRPPTCGRSPARRLRWQVFALLCLTGSVERYQPTRPRGVARILAVQRGGDFAGSRGTRNRLSDWPGFVQVDQLRRWMLRTTTCPVTGRFSSLVATG